MAVKLANDPSSLAQCEAQLHAAPRVAVDTEFHAERRYMPRLYLVQLHVEGGDTWLVDPLHEGALSTLSEALLSCLWVVHGGTQDMRLLQRALGGLPTQVLDTQIGAALVQQIFPASYAFLQKQLVGHEPPKRATLSDWSKRPLSQTQLEYAAEDVDLLLPLWDHIQEQLERHQRLHLAHAACAEAVQRVVDPPATDLAWRDIHAVTFLTPQQAAVAQELAAWRIEQARRNNQPVRSVLPDGLLADLSRTQPSVVSSLSENRRLSRSLVRKSGDEIIERIARAKARPAWAWPRVIPTSSPEAGVVRWLCLLAETIGRERDFAHALVLPPRLAEDATLLESPDRTALSEILGWRDPLVGEAVHAALKGEATLGLCPGVRRTRIFLSEDEE